jgi:hypothetical protein
MAAVSDDRHAVRAETVEVVQKVDDLHTLPVPSYWYLDLQTTGGYSRSVFTDESSRDDFYKKLVDVMGQ